MRLRKKLAFVIYSSKAKLFTIFANDNKFYITSVKF